ncbi:hypothetical protein B0H12DRAFT_81634 [Mycena haematopus]|nr:hypothetical protein B0H12DRAFT_81634 [Mycena haematopus]
MPSPYFSCWYAAGFKGGAGGKVRWMGEEVCAFLSLSLSYILPFPFVLSFFDGDSCCRDVFTSPLHIPLLFRHRVSLLSLYLLGSAFW